MPAATDIGDANPAPVGKNRTLRKTKERTGNGINTLIVDERERVVVTGTDHEPCVAECHLAGHVEGYRYGPVRDDKPRGISGCGQERKAAGVVRCSRISVKTQRAT